MGWPRRVYALPLLREVEYWLGRLLLQASLSCWHRFLLREPRRVCRDFVHHPVDRGLGSGCVGAVTDERYLLRPVGRPHPRQRRGYILILPCVFFRNGAGPVQRRYSTPEWPIFLRSALRHHNPFRTSKRVGKYHKPATMCLSLQEATSSMTTLQTAESTRQRPMPPIAGGSNPRPAVR
jgi:hypothetical protein